MDVDETCSKQLGRVLAGTAWHTDEGEQTKRDGQLRVWRL